MNLEMAAQRLFPMHIVIQCHILWPGPKHSYRENFFIKRKIVQLCKPKDNYLQQKISYYNNSFYVNVRHRGEKINKN